MIGTTETSWDAMQLALLAAAFLAAALALEGLVLLWHQTRSPTVQRLRRRLQAWVPEAGGPSAAGSHGALSISERGRWPHVLERLQAEAEARWQRRPSRMRQLVSQLPDALDLMSRAMRSGHAFSTAVQMVAEDGPQPLAGILAASLQLSLSF